MTYPAYRRGTFALLDGVLHEASYGPGAELVRLNSRQAGNPDPALYDWDDAEAQWLATVPADRCSRVFSVDVYASYRGHSVLVGTISDTGSAHIMYAEWDGLWATGNGFIQENKYEYYKTVPVTELRDYYEKQGDLLFARWRDETFAGTGQRKPRPVAVQERPRTGLLATLSEVEYQADAYPHEGHIVLSAAGKRNPDQDQFTWDSGRQRWSARVPVSECTRLAEVTTRAEYRGRPCQVRSIAADGTVVLEHLAKEAKAAEDEFEPDADGVWTKSVHVFDIARYHEHHVDLLFDEWSRSLG